MTPTHTTGLVVGKFWPPHRGHQLLLETAAAQVSELVVLVYANPDAAAMPAAVRAQWLRELYRGDELGRARASGLRRCAYSPSRQQRMGCRRMRPMT